MSSQNSNLSHERISAILKDILDAKVLDYKPLTPHRQLNTYECILEDGRKVVLKNAGVAEIENQGIANLLGLNAPRLVGKPYKCVDTPESYWYLQEYINSTRLDTLIRQGASDYKTWLEMAINLLIKLQLSLKKFEEQKGTPLKCLTCGPDFASRMNEQQERHIESVLMKLSKKGVLEPGDVEFITSIDLDQIIKTLTTKEEECVLMRWDYRPDHLLVGLDGLIYLIDWVKVMKGSKWIDLAFLVGDLSIVDRKHCLNYYEESAMIENTNNEEKLVAALRLVQLTHISANCNLMSLDEDNRDNYVKNIRRHISLIKNY